MEPKAPRILGPDTPMTLYILRHRFLVDHAVFEANYAEHRAFVLAKIEAGVMLCGGPTVPWDGGMILLCANSLADAQTFAEEDPMAARGFTEYEITEWKTTTRADDFTRVIAQHISALN